MYKMSPFLPLNGFFELENSINGPRKSDTLRSWKCCDLYIKVTEKSLNSVSGSQREIGTRAQKLNGETSVFSVFQSLGILKE